MERPRGRPRRCRESYLVGLPDELIWNVLRMLPVVEVVSAERVSKRFKAIICAKERYHIKRGISQPFWNRLSLQVDGYKLDVKCYPWEKDGGKRVNYAYEGGLEVDVRFYSAIYLRRLRNAHATPLSRWFRRMKWKDSPAGCYTSRTSNLLFYDLQGGVKITELIVKNFTRNYHRMWEFCDWEDTVLVTNNITREARRLREDDDIDVDEMTARWMAENFPRPLNLMWDHYYND